MTSTHYYLDARAVRVRYSNISAMTLWRWLHDHTLAFPQPMVIHQRRYWRTSDLDVWDETRRGSQPDRR
jgi:trehalose-6-phosphate synthase